MPEYLVLVVLFVGLFVLEILYFRIANNYKIIDIPNERSSHKKFTIRGGGVIFPLAIILGWLLKLFSFHYFVFGLLLISIISFVDDVKDVHSKVRFLFHFCAVSIILFAMPFSSQVFWYVPIVIVTVGAINAWNFMDGINGITGGYSLITIGTLYYINYFIYPFTDNGLLLTVFIALVVFNFFNFRKRAVCFAGDVGSVSIAFIICYLIIQLVVASENFLFVGMILLYGLDTATTILFRIIRKENIFLAHRSHFYQFLVNEQRLPHLGVASFYCLMQLAVNVLIISEFPVRSGFIQSGTELLVLLLVSTITFLLTRFYLEGSDHLIG